MYIKLSFRIFIIYNHLDREYKCDTAISKNILNSGIQSNLKNSLFPLNDVKKSY